MRDAAFLVMVRSSYFFAIMTLGLFTVTTRIHPLRLGGLGQEGSFVARLREQRYFFAKFHFFVILMINDRYEKTA